MESEIKTEKLKIDSVEEPQKKKNGGARPGAGRKKGGMNQATKEREQALREYRERVSKLTDGLLNKQLSLAEGVQMLFRIDKDSKGNNLKPELVTDKNEIQEYIDNLVNGTLQSSDSYYFITTAKPDNFAIRDILDRTYGKPEQSTTLKNDGENPLVIKIDSNVAGKYKIDEVN